MRLDHLLSKEEEVEEKIEALFNYEGSVKGDVVRAPQEESSFGRGRAAYGLKSECGRQASLSSPFQYQFALITEFAEFPVAMRLGETPVPIPNTMVKPQAADGTMLETAWESRWLPDLPNGGVAQLGEHLPCKQGVKGSNPSISIKMRP